MFVAVPAPLPRPVTLPALLPVLDLELLEVVLALELAAAWLPCRSVTAMSALAAAGLPSVRPLDRSPSGGVLALRKGSGCEVEGVGEPPAGRASSGVAAC